LELGKRAQCQERPNHAGEVCQATLERAGEREELGSSSKGWSEVLQLVYECDGLISAILHVRGDVNVGYNRDTLRHEPVRGMLDIEDARRLLSGAACWGRGDAIDGALVEGGRATNCSAVLCKRGEGCGDSWRGPCKVCVSGVRNGVHGRVRGSNGLKWSLMQHCEEERPERVPLACPAGGYDVDSVCRVCGRRSKLFQRKQFTYKREACLSLSLTQT
jgi:hypothetical protein